VYTNHFGFTESWEMMTTVLLALGDPDLRAACQSQLDSAGVASIVLNRPLAAISLASKVAWDAALVDDTPLGQGALASLPSREPRATVIGLGAVEGVDLSLALPLQAAQLKHALGRNRNGVHRPETRSLVLDQSRRVAQANDLDVMLTRTEYRLLQVLHDRRPEDVALGDVLEAVWGSREGVGTAELVRTHIRNLRAKLSQIGMGEAIRSKRGRGYSLEA